MKQNSWHKTMYDKWFASTTLNSEQLLKSAVTESHFILNQTSLKIGSHILDVPCGTGRHAIQFAKLGHYVTAIDISKDCINIAKKGNAHKSIRYDSGDMVNLSKYKGKFDLVTNLFSSFGYFSTDKENENVLKEMHHALKPGGQICIFNINRDWLMTIFSKNDWRETPQEFILHDRKFDPITKFSEARMIVINKKSGKRKEYFHRMRLYSKAEMVTLMRKIGFKRIEVFGNNSGEKFSKLKSTHPFYFGIK
ncbi:MAG: class I SAM-dependent methyltransferase [Bacteriovoracaceae bacterium]